MLSTLASGNSPKRDRTLPCKTLYAMPTSITRFLQNRVAKKVGGKTKTRSQFENLPQTCVVREREEEKISGEDSVAQRRRARATPTLVGALPAAGERRRARGPGRPGQGGAGGGREEEGGSDEQEGGGGARREGIRGLADGLPVVEGMRADAGGVEHG